MNDPGFTERQAVRKAVVAAREIRIAERRARPRRRERLGRPPRKQPTTKQLNVRHRRRPSKLNLPLKKNGRLGKRQPGWLRLSQGRREIAS
jgi:hypothetical protein